MISYANLNSDPNRLQLQNQAQCATNMRAKVIKDQKKAARKAAERAAKAAEQAAKKAARKAKK